MVIRCIGDDLTVFAYDVSHAPFLVAVERQL